MCIRDSSCVWRTRRELLPMGVHVVLFGAYAAWGLCAVSDPGWLLLSLLLANVTTSGRMLISRVLDRPAMNIDPIHAALVTMGLVLGLAGDAFSVLASQVLVLYLSISILLDGRSAVRALRKHLDRNELLGRLFVPRR